MKYKTLNFYLSVFLIANGFSLDSTEPADNNKNKFLFCFEDTRELQEAIKEFFSLQSTVNTHNFMNAQRMLKNIIYS